MEVAHVSSLKTYKEVSLMCPPCVCVVQLVWVGMYACSRPPAACTGGEMEALLRVVLGG